MPILLGQDNMRLINQHGQQKSVNQTGFSLIELMVGLVIGLLATLVIMQIYSVFEGQKRTTSGTSDAQTSGSVALYTMQRDLQLAGFGLPLFDRDNMPLRCATTSFDHDGNAATSNISTIPIEITNGALATDSDTITVRYGTSPNAGVPVLVNVVTGSVVTVDTNMACASNDTVYLMNLTTGAGDCKMTMVNDTAANLAANPQKIKLQSVANIINIASSPSKTNLSCLGTWNEFTYAVNANSELTRNGIPIVTGIVNIQAQYGISARPNGATGNQIARWVNATDAWATPGIASATCDLANANRNCIKAVRIAVVARNDLLEKLPAVSFACSSVTAANPTGVCAWDATSAAPLNPSPAPAIDLSNTASWDQYRYKVYETIIPLRNMIWTNARL